MKQFVFILFIIGIAGSLTAQEEVHIYNIEPSIEKLFEKSNKAFNKGKPDKAIDFLEQAREKAPGNVQVLDKLAGLYYDENQKLDAKNVYKEIQQQINETLSGEHELTNTITDELQVILDLANKRVTELEEEWPDEPEGPDFSAVDSEPIPQPVMSFDEVDPNLEKKFLTTPKPLDEKASFDQQVKKVKDEVLEQYDKIENKNDWFSNDFNEILEINNDWLRHSAISKLSWFSGLKAKEKEYLVSIDQYEVLRQEKDRLFNTRTIILEEISNLDLKTRWENEKRLDLQNKLQTRLKEELKGKLSAIPQSIVLIGRTKLSDDRHGLSIQEARTRRNQKLMEEMQKEAIRLVGGQKIDMYSSMQDNELKQFFSTTSQGTAQTIDNYYKDLNIEFKQEGKFTYLISRIEVFPLDNATMNGSANEASSSNVFNGGNMNTTVYQWIEQDSLLENCSNSRDRKKFYAHKFKDQERNYLDFQTRFSQSLNDRYKAEIEKAGMEYDQSVRETQFFINQSLNNIMSYEKSSATLQDSLQVVEDILRTMDSQIAESRAKAQRLAREYQVYYRSKNSQINKLVIQSSMESNYSTKETFRSMVDKTLSGLEDIRKKSQSLVVYKEVTSDGESIKASEHTVEFEPVLRRFRILSMNKFEDEEGDIFYSMNIAYDVGWNPIRETREQDTPVETQPVANTGVITDVALPVTPDPVPTARTVGQTVGLGVGTKFNGDGSVTIELEGKRMDILIVPDASSKVSYLYSDLPTQWRIPTVSELQKIFKLASINKGTSDDFIQKKFNWMASWAAFLTDETNTNYQNEVTNTCLELSRIDYSTRKDELLDDEEVHLLLIRK